MGPVRQNPIQRTVRSVHMCVRCTAQLLHTILHRTDLIVFPLTIQTITTARMIVYLREGGVTERGYAAFGFEMPQNARISDIFNIRKISKCVKFRRAKFL